MFVLYWGEVEIIKNGEPITYLDAVTNQRVKKTFKTNETVGKNAIENDKPRIADIRAT